MSTTLPSGFFSLVISVSGEVGQQRKASRHLMGRLEMKCPLMSPRARSRSGSDPKRTKPYPFDLDVKGSVMTCRGSIEGLRPAQAPGDSQADARLWCGGTPLRCGPRESTGGSAPARRSLSHPAPDRQRTPSDPQLQRRLASQKGVAGCNDTQTT